MAGEGTRYIKGKVSKTSRDLQVNTTPQVPSETLAKLNNDRTEATFIDGSVKQVTPVGSPGAVSLVVNAHTNNPIAYGQSLEQYVVDGRAVTALIMERTPLSNSGLAVRRIGNDTKFFVPQSLDPKVSSDYVGGFSSNGAHLFIAGAWAENLGEDTYVSWNIYKNFRLEIGTGGSNTIVADEVQSGTVNLNDVYHDQISRQLRPPNNAWDEDNTPGLAGTDRGKYIWNMYVNPNDDGPPPTPAEVSEFLNYLAEYFELTEEEQDLLMFDELEELYTRRYLNAQGAQFKPAYFIEFHNEILPYQYIFDGLPGLSTGDADFQITTSYVEYDGFKEETWNYEEETQPVFMEVNFAFNNTLAGEPILDIVASYRTAALYHVSRDNFETVLHSRNDYSGSTMIFLDSYFSRARDESYVYSYPDNIVYDTSQTVNFTITDPPDGVNNHNYFMKGEGFDSSINDGARQGWTQYFPSLWFDDYWPGLGNEDHLPQCDIWTTNPNFGGEGVDNPDCAYYKYSPPGTSGLNPSQDAAFFQRFGGHPYYFLINAYYPPDTGFYTYTYWNGTAITNPGGFYYPVAPMEFFTYFPWLYEPHFGGYFLLEDAYGGWILGPRAGVFQIGRGVMAIKDANTSPRYSYIDRPPAAPQDYDHLYNPYLGANETRAIVVKEDHFGAYAYSPEYVETTNQIVGLVPPDTVTDIYYIDGGTWPFQFDFLKGVSSEDFIQYWRNDTPEGIREYISHIHLESTTFDIEFGKFKSGVLPSDAGTLLDCTIKGLDFSDS